MKRIFTILALASAFTLAMPATSEAAPRKDKNKSAVVAKKSPQRHVAVRSSRYHHHPSSFIRGGFYRYRPGPVVAPRYYPRRGLFNFVIRL